MSDVNQAVEMFVSQKVSLAKAAQLTGQNLAEFMDTLKERGIPAFTYTEEMLADDMKFVDEL